MMKRETGYWVLKIIFAIGSVVAGCTGHGDAAIGFGLAVGFLFWMADEEQREGGQRQKSKKSDEGRT